MFEIDLTGDNDVLKIGSITYEKSQNTKILNQDELLNEGINQAKDRFKKELDEISKHGITKICARNVSTGTQSKAQVGIQFEDVNHQNRVQSIISSITKNPNWSNSSWDKRIVY